MEVINGYNHNIKYKDDIFHVQTEDSGVEKAHVITHLFIGGNIINTDKQSYAHLLDNPDWRKKVVEMMQSMHKNMMKGLIKGAYDDRISSRSTGASFLNGPAPLNMDAGSQHRSSFGAQAASSPVLAPTTAEIVAHAPEVAAQAAKMAATSITIPKVTAPINSKPIQLPRVAPVVPAAISTDPIMPVIPSAATATTTAPTAAKAQEYDGTFQVEGNLADLLWEAATTISSEDLEKALNSNDDSLLFGDTEEKSDQGLDDMMMSFLGGM